MADTQLNRNGKPKGRAGRLPFGRRRLGPEKVAELERRWLAGETMAAIARDLGCSATLVRYLVKTVIEPELRGRTDVQLGELLAKTRLVEREAWEAFRKTGRQSFLTSVAWAIEFAARISGLLVDRHEVEHKGGIRVCGQSPVEFDEQTIGEILRRVAQRRAGQAELDSHRPELN